MKVAARFMGTVLGLTSLACAEFKMDPDHFGASIDFGQVMRVDYPATNINDLQPLNRTGVFLTNSGSYDKRFEVRLTIGGLFWYALPERSATQTHILFGPGVGEAQGLYKFGNPEAPTASLQLGLFGHKYNPDAKNLGEYLFRSGAYPGYIWTGGWSYVNSAAYLAQGIRLNVPMFSGALSHDFTLYMERDILPAHDLTPAYLLTWKPTGFLEVGAGLAWQNGISFKPDSILQPHDLRNAYSKNSGLPLTDAERNAPGLSRDSLDYYSFQGFKGMARLSADIGLLAGLPANSFKIYSEIALLGFKDYPFYYENKSERMPLMAGINIPTFGLLDMLSFECEYLKSPFKNNIHSVYINRMPLPLGETENDPTQYRRELWRARSLAGGSAADTLSFDSLTTRFESEATRDDFKWTLYARRKIMEGISITAQAASDHFRPFEIVYARPKSEPITTRAKEWYYVLRLEFGI
ncbi:MAG: hypothetical protein ABIW76_07100 [Fibrobacteria bacterium]